MECINCKKQVDKSKEYFTLCYEVGDRNNKNIPELQMRKWDALEEEREITLCYECGELLDSARKDRARANKVIDKFFNFVKK